MIKDKDIPKPDPCPFCSGKLVVSDHNKGEWFLRCQQCRARGPVTPVRESSIQAWNNRFGVKYDMNALRESK